MKKIFATIILLASTLAVSQTSKINIPTQTTGNLPISRLSPGGTAVDAMSAGQTSVSCSNGLLHREAVTSPGTLTLANPTSCQDNQEVTFELTNSTGSTTNFAFGTQYTKGFATLSNVPNGAVCMVSGHWNNAHTAVYYDWGATTGASCSIGFLPDLFTTIGDSVIGAASGLPTRVPAPTGPNGVPQVLVEIPSGGVATLPTYGLPGVGGRPVLGTTSTDVITSTDCSPLRVVYKTTVSVAVTLPTPTTLGVPNCTFKIANNAGSGNTVTITPTTWTISAGSGGTAGSTLVLQQGQEAVIYVDTVTASNWAADVVEQGVTAGSNITVTRTASGHSIGVTNSAVTVNVPAPLAGSGGVSLGGTLNITWSNFAGNTVLANCTGSSAVPTACALTSAMIPNNGANTTGSASSITVLTTNGDLLIQASGANSRLAIGSSGQFLSVTGAGLPGWNTHTTDSAGIFGYSGSVGFLGATYQSNGGGAGLFGLTQGADNGGSCPVNTHCRQAPASITTSWTTTDPAAGPTSSGQVEMHSNTSGSPLEDTITLQTLSAVNPQTATYQVTAADFAGYKTITVASGTFNITLVASGSQPATGQYINVINYGTGTVTIVRSGQNINGATTSIVLDPALLYPTEARIISDGTNYFDKYSVWSARVLGVLDQTGVSVANSGTPQNILASVPAAGHYRLFYYIDQSAGCTTLGSGALTSTATWTDAIHARSSPVKTLPVATVVTSANDWIGDQLDFWAASASAITITATYTACTTGTWTYDLHAYVERVE